MKVALAVNYVANNIENNIKNIFKAINEATRNNANLILFPEAAITGLINNDIPEHDLPLGVPIPGEFTQTLIKISKENNIYIGIGLLELEEKRLYDSAILISPDQGIILKYRRITSGWHGKKVNSEIYCEGIDIKKVKTPFGSFAFLICGDLFDDKLVYRIKKMKVDYLLYPFARCFFDGSYNQKMWDEEKLEYVNQIEKAGTTTFMVNYLAKKEFDGGSFGGAMVVSGNKNIICEMPIGRQGILYVEL